MVCYLKVYLSTTFNFPKKNFVRFYMHLKKNCVMIQTSLLRHKGSYFSKKTNHTSLLLQMVVYGAYFRGVLYLSSPQVGAHFFICRKIQLIVSLWSWKEVSVPVLSSSKRALVLCLESMLLGNTNLPLMP